MIAPLAAGSGGSSPGTGRSVARAVSARPRFARLAALVVAGPRAEVPWLAIFLGLLVASAFVELDEVDRLSSTAIAVFFILSLGAVTTPVSAARSR
jgi:hypothetical protein